MTDQTVRARFDADVSGYLSGLQRAAAATQQFATQAQGAADKGLGAFQRHERAFDGISKAALGMGAVAAAGIGVAVSGFMEFDAAMSNVAASTGASAQDLQLLRQAAMDAGATFGQFTSTEAANAIEELGKAGLSTAAIMGGGLHGAMALAASDNMAVAEAAELTANTLSMFKLEGTEATHVADLLAQGAGAASGSAHDLGMGLSQVGSVAHSMGLSVDETATTLALFASNGIKGSDAGTSLKTMLLSLSNPSEKASKAMAELGINAFDATGSFVGMRELSRQLAEGTRNLGTEQKNAALATIFGSDAMRVAAIAASEGAEGYDAMSKSMAGFGSATDMAAKRTDNLKGDLAELGGAWENATIKFGESANGPLRSMTQWLTSLVEAASNASPAMQTAAMGTLGFVAAVGLVGGGALQAMRGIIQFREAVQTLELARHAQSAWDMVGGLKGLGAAAVVAGLAIGAIELAKALQPGPVLASADAVEAALLNVSRRGEDAHRTLNQFFQVEGGGGIQTATEIRSIEQAFRSLNPAMQDTGDKVNAWAAGMDKSLFGWSHGVEAVKDSFASMDAELAKMDAASAGNAFAEISSSARAAGTSVDDLAKLFPTYRAELEKQAASVGISNLSTQQLVDWMGGKVPAAVRNAAASMQSADAATQALALGNATAAQSLQATAKAADDAREAFIAYGNAQLAASGSAIGVQAAIDNATAAVQKNGQTLDINTAAGRANQQALDGIAASALKNLEAQYQAGAGTEELTRATEQAREAFVNAGVQMGMTSQQAEALATKYNLVPKTVTTLFTTPGSGASAGEARNVRAQIEMIPGRKDSAIIVTSSGTAWAAAQIDTAARDRYATIWVRTVGTGGSGPREYNPDAMAAAGGAAEGGLIGGYSPHPKADNILTWLTANEFVQPVESVGYYGVRFMEALRRRLIPRELLALLLPGYAEGGQVAAPRPAARAAYATGGQVAGGLRLDVAFPSEVVLLDADGSILTRAHVIAADAVEAGARNRNHQTRLAGVS